MSAVPIPDRRVRRAPNTTRPGTEPRRAAGARRPAAARRRLAPTTAALMAVCAALLAGIVAVQVAALRQNIARGELDQTRQELIARNMSLQAKLDVARSKVKVQERAAQLGMYRPLPDSVEYVSGG